MKKNRIRKVRSMTIYEPVVTAFLRKYTSQSASRFCERAMYLAVKDREFFEKVFFGVKDEEVMNKDGLLLHKKADRPDD